MNTAFQVVNHTSDQAPQFIESAAAAPGSTSEEGSKRDWYIWKKGTVNENGERVPPNNWGAAFGGVGWPTSG
jgi:oligo-1,6-glucosidase